MPYAAYADVNDLQVFLGQSAPNAEAEAQATRMLLRASELISDCTMTARYATDEHGMPTENDIVAAFRDSTCAQVEFWLASDEEDDILGPIDNISIGSLKVAYSAVSAGRVAPMLLAPRAARILREACLYGAPVLL